MRIKISLIALIGAPLFLMITVAAGFASPLRVGSTMTYIYNVEERADGTLKVSVSIPAMLDDPVTMPRYREVNRARAQALIQSGRTERIEVQVTFTRPIPWEEARALSQAADLVVDNYLMVGTGHRGEKAIVIFNQSLDGEAPPNLLLGPRGQVTTLWGVMVLQGNVLATPEGLGRLLNDPRIYLVDTTAVEIRQAIKNNPLWRNKEITSISLPSPFWSLIWGDTR